MLALNDVVHPAARRLTPGAQTPVFVCDTASPDAVLIEYRSHRNLCAFAHGLIDGVAAHYGETVAITHRECKREGDPRCVLELARGA